MHGEPPWQAYAQSVGDAGGALRERLAHRDLQQLQHNALALADSVGQRSGGSAWPRAHGKHDVR